MIIEVLKVKIHGATVTESNLHYEGSIGIDAGLMKAAGLREYEKVDVLNITNGERITTYVIVLETPGAMTINGGAARKFQVGDSIIVISYCAIGAAEQFVPIKLFPDKDNKI